MGIDLRVESTARDETTSVCQRVTSCGGHHGLVDDRLSRKLPRDIEGHSANPTFGCYVLGLREPLSPATLSGAMIPPASRAGSIRRTHSLSKFATPAAGFRCRASDVSRLDTFVRPSSAASRGRIVRSRLLNVKAFSVSCPGRRSSCCSESERVAPRHLTSIGSGPCPLAPSTRPGLLGVRPGLCRERMLRQRSGCPKRQESRRRGCRIATGRDSPHATSACLRHASRHATRSGPPTNSRPAKRRLAAGGIERVYPARWP